MRFYMALSTASGGSRDMPPRNYAKPGGSIIPAEEAFVVTIGVPHRHKDHYCKRALLKLQAAGFQVGQTSDEAILQLAEQVKLNQALKDNDPE